MHRDAHPGTDSRTGPSRDELKPSLENSAITICNSLPDSSESQLTSTVYSQSSELPSSSDNNKIHPYNKHNMSQSQDLDELEKAEATPRSSLCVDPLSPRQPPLGRVPGRRPLSIISNSSLNSDVSPPSRSPDSYSPNRHRRHRSVIGASVDYRHHGSLYNNNGPYQNAYAYSNPFQSPHTPCQQPYQGLNISNAGMPPPGPQQSGGPHPTQQPPSSYQGNNYQYRSYSGSSANSQGFPLLDPLVTTPLMGGFSQYPIAFPSPMSPSLSSREIPAAISLAAAAAASSIGIQDIFVALAYKERQVLEARQNWEAAKVDLESFRRQLDSMLAPEIEPLILPVRPTIISRRCTPNIGIHSLQYSPASNSTPRREAPQVALWRIDCSVPTPSQPANFDEMAEQYAHTNLDEEADESHHGITLTIVKCLLGIVQCVISTLPVYQRDIIHQGRRAIAWTPEYPMPMDTLFGHLA